VTSVTAATDAAPRVSRMRIVTARSLTVLGLIFALLSLVAVYVRYELLDNNTFRGTAQQLVVNPAIQQQITERAVETLYSNVDVAGELEKRLPAQQKGLAIPLAAALRGVSDRLVLQGLAQPAVQRLVVNSVVTSHRELVSFLENRGTFASLDNGVVQVDLRQVVRELTSQLGLSPSIADRIPDSAAKVTVVRSDQLRSVQRGVRLLNFLARWLWVFVLGAWALAIWLVPGRRRFEVRAIAIGFAIVGVLILLVRHVAGNYVVSHIVTTPSVRPSAHAAYAIVTRHLSDAGWTYLFVGLIAVLGVWLVGPGSRAQLALHWLAPYLRRPILAYGTFLVLWLLLLLWSPTVQFRRGPSLVLLFVLSAVGVEALRRIAHRRYPGAEAAGFGVWWGHLRDSWSAHRPAPAPSAAGPDIAQLESLSRLHDAGKLTDEEFTSLKARLLA
jgi:Short C-terminal domain